MDRLLPHGHVLGVFLQPVKGRVWLHADAIVMVLRVPPGRRVREKAESSEKEETCRCYRYHYPLSSVSYATFIRPRTVMRLQLSASTTTSSCFVPGAKAASPQAHEDGADELAEGGRVDRIQLLFLTVPQVMVIERAPGQAHPLGRLIVVQQPLQLERRVR